MMDRNEEFKERLKASLPGVRHVYSVLAMSGIEVFWPWEVAVLPDPVEAGDSTGDRGDLFVRMRGGSIRRIEVKHLGVNFTSMKDWPKSFGKHVFVDTPQAVARLSGDALCYISVSKDMSHWAIIPCETKSQWYNVERWNGVTKRMQITTTCSRFYTTFVSSSEKITLDMLEFTRPEARSYLDAPR